MRHALHWMKTNIVTVISVGLCLLALGFLGYVHLRGKAFVERLSKRATEVRQIQGLTNFMVMLPPVKPNGPPQQTVIAVNQAAIDQITETYQKMNDEYVNIFKFTLTINRGSHRPMLDGLFPEPVNDAKPFDARTDYQRAYRDFLEEWTPNEPIRLDAGMPAPLGDVTEELKKVEEDFNSENLSLGEGAATMTEKEIERLQARKTKRLMDMYKRQSQAIHIYAVRDESSPEYPFEIMPWARDAAKPKIEDIWESQMGLWIAQDIVDAIARTNRVELPEWNVSVAPIKRLLSIRVVPGYVGLNGSGGMNTTGAESIESAPVAAPAAGAEAAPVAAESTVSADTPLPDNFAVAPTGRRSNALYDVRHVRVELIADMEKLPDFFNQLAKVNFMTVLKMEVSDVDEYEALKQGFVYGSNDVARIDMLIETIWLRRWTAGHKDEAEAKLLNEPFDRGLMPDPVRIMLGMAPRKAVAPVEPATESP